MYTVLALSILLLAVVTWVWVLFVELHERRKRKDWREFA